MMATYDDDESEITEIYRTLPAMRCRLRKSSQELGLLAQANVLHAHAIVVKHSFAQERGMAHSPPSAVGGSGCPGSTCPGPGVDSPGSGLTRPPAGPGSARGRDSLGLRVAPVRHSL